MSKKVSDDIARVKEESRVIIEKKNRENFIKMIDFQIEDTIISPIKKFIAKFNSKYVGEKAEYSILSNNHGEVFYSGRMSITPFKYVNIKIERVFKENHRRQVYNPWRLEYYSEENYIPQYNKKNILAMGEIKNNKNYGFNIILVDNGEIYGDWLIVENKNYCNITGETRAEPFAFSLEELPKRIDLGNCVDLYSSTYCSFDDNYFLKLINILISELS